MEEKGAAHELVLVRKGRGWRMHGAMHVKDAPGLHAGLGWSYREGKKASTWCAA